MRWTCIVFALLVTQNFTTLPMANGENNLKEEKPRKCTAIFRNIAEIVFDVVFLAIRLVIVFKYKKDESIFIAKNGIGIILASFEIHDLLSKG